MLLKVAFEFLNSFTRKILRHFQTRGSWYGDERPFLDRVRLGYWILVNSAIWSERPRQYSISRSNELLPHFYTLKVAFITLLSPQMQSAKVLSVFHSVQSHFIGFTSKYNSDITHISGRQMFVRRCDSGKTNREIVLITLYFITAAFTLLCRPNPLHVRNLSDWATFLALEIPQG